MTKESIFRILNSLTLNEWNDLKNCSYSPLFNLYTTYNLRLTKNSRTSNKKIKNKSKHIIIYECLFQNRKRLVIKSNFIFEKLCEIIYIDSDKKSLAKCSKILSEFYKKIEPFIAKLKHLEKVPEVATQISMLNFYSQNDFQEVFIEYNKKLKKKLSLSEYLSKDLYYQYEYFKTISIHHKQKKLKDIDQSLTKSLNFLSDFYYLNTLKFACAILNYNLIYKKNQEFPQVQMPLVSFSNPIIHSFHSIYIILEKKYLSTTSNSSTFSKHTLKEVKQILHLLKNTNKKILIEKEDIKSIYQLLLNTCRFNLSFTDNSFFILFKKVLTQMIKQEMITERKTMDARFYKAIIEVLSYGSFYDEAIKFSQKFSPNLDLDIKQNFEIYCKALSLFLMSKTEKSYHVLKPILKNEKDSQLYIAIQKLYIKLCFKLINNLQLDTPEELIRTQERLYKYLNRKGKELPKNELQETMNFITLSKKIYKSYNTGKISIEGLDFKKNPIHVFDMYWIKNNY